MLRYIGLAALAYPIQQYSAWYLGRLEMVSLISCEKQNELNISDQFIEMKQKKWKTQTTNTDIQLCIVVINLQHVQLNFYMQNYA